MRLARYAFITLLLLSENVLAQQSSRIAAPAPAPAKNSCILSAITAFKTALEGRFNAKCDYRNERMRLASAAVTPDKLSQYMSRYESFLKDGNMNYIPWIPALTPQVVQCNRAAVSLHFLEHLKEFANRPDVDTEKVIFLARDLANQASALLYCPNSSCPGYETFRDVSKESCGYFDDTPPGTVRPTTTETRTR